MQIEIENLYFEEDSDLLKDVMSVMNKVKDAVEKTEDLHFKTCAHIQLVDNQTIKQINSTFRNMDKETDVLSFPSIEYKEGKTAHSSQKSLSNEYDDTMDGYFLGDIIISMPYAMRQAKEFGHSQTREVAYLATHGFFHIMGYDHMNEEDKKRMRAMEEKALQSIGIERITEDDLIKKAQEAMQVAYAPYSGFKVGACLLTKSGRVYTGCNVENASFGATNCAERTAVFKAVSEGETEFEKIAIVASKGLAFPCGICRQVLNEFAPQIDVIVSYNGQTIITKLNELLPHGFGPQNLTNENA